MTKREASKRDDIFKDDNEKTGKYYVFMTMRLLQNTNMKHWKKHVKSFRKLYHMFITTLIQKMAITERCY